MSTAPAIFLTASELERLILDLPAEQRAQFQWAPKRYRQIVEQLLVEDLSSTLVQRVAAEFIRFAISLGEKFLAHHGDNTPLVQEWVKNLSAVTLLDSPKAYFRDSPVADEVDWVCDVLANLYRHLRADLGAKSREQLKKTFSHWEPPSDEDVSQRFVGSFLGPQVLVAALLRGIELGLPPERMEKQVECAYLETARCVDAYAMRGIDFDPLHQLSPEQRFDKAQRYIEALREVMTPEDVDTLSQTRVTSL